MAWLVGSGESNPNATSWKLDWKLVKQELQQIFKSNANKALLAKLAQQSKSEKSSQEKI